MLKGARPLLQTWHTAVKVQVSAADASVIYSYFYTVEGSDCPCKTAHPLVIAHTCKHERAYIYVGVQGPRTCTLARGGRGGT